MDSEIAPHHHHMDNECRLVSLDLGTVQPEMRPEQSLSSPKLSKPKTLQVYSVLVFYCGASYLCVHFVQDFSEIFLVAIILGIMALLGTAVFCCLAACDASVFPDDLSLLNYIYKGRFRESAEMCMGGAGSLIIAAVLFSLSWSMYMTGPLYYASLFSGLGSFFFGLVSFFLLPLVFLCYGVNVSGDISKRLGAGSLSDVASCTTVMGCGFAAFLTVPSLLVIVIANILAIVYVKLLGETTIPNMRFPSFTTYIAALFLSAVGALCLVVMSPLLRRY